MCSAVLPKPMPGSMQICVLGAIPLARATRPARPGTPRPRRPRRRSGGRAASSSARPACASGRRARPPRRRPRPWRDRGAAPRRRSRSRRPARIAASATTAFTVSIEMGTSVSAARRADHRQHPPAARRRAGRGPTPGRVDSPPTSRMSAPSATSCRPWATAAPGRGTRPPSENESGVTLTTPITAGAGNRSRSEVTGAILESPSPATAPRGGHRVEGSPTFHTSHTEVEAEMLRAGARPGQRRARGRLRSDDASRPTSATGSTVSSGRTWTSPAGGRTPPSTSSSSPTCAARFHSTTGAFDLVYANFVVEHLEGPALAFAEWHRVLRPGGSVILLTSNRTNPLMAAGRIVPQRRPHRGEAARAGRRGPGCLPRPLQGEYALRRSRPGCWARPGSPPVRVVFVATLHRYAGRRRLAAAALRDVEHVLPPRLRSTIVAWYRRDDPAQRRYESVVAVGRSRS